MTTAKRRIAIATPSGYIGSNVLERIALARASDPAHRDVELVLLARKPAKFAGWAASGVTVHGGRLEDPDFLVEATRGVSTLYWATPNSFEPSLTMGAGYRSFAESAVAAITANRIGHTVHLSGFAHVEDGGGEESLFAALAQTERMLDEAVEQLRLAHPGEQFGITHVRAGFLFENFLGQLESLRAKGRLYLPVAMNRPIPMVASRDVAEVVAGRLLSEPPSGRVLCGAYGPEDMPFGRVADALTAGLGRRIRVYRLPRFVIRTQMLRLGRDPRAVQAFIHAFRAITRGRVTAEPPRDAASTTPTSLATWAAEVLRPIMESGDGAMCPVRVQYEPPESLSAAAEPG